MESSFPVRGLMPQHDKSKEILAQGATPKAPKTLL
jgi:hypothetical protein